MIRFSYTLRKGKVFVSCPETVDEEQQLSTLAGEVRMICKTVKKTDLWIVAELQAGLKKVLVTSLKEKVEMDSNEIPLLQVEVKARLTK